MLRQIKNSIPNTITLFNLLSGLTAILFAFRMQEDADSWQCGALAIGAAAVFDFCDGLAARLLNARSAIGKELDSLADLVSFGVAPAMLLLNTLQLAGAGDMAYAALFIPLMGALRLAIFNVDDSQATTFRGLPIPANAIFWIGAVAAITSGVVRPSVTVCVVVIAIVSLLMVSRAEMFSLKFKNLNFFENFNRYLIVAATVACVVIFGVAGLALAIIIYILLSIVKIRITFE